MTNLETFKQIYLAELEKDFKAHRSLYAYGLNRAPAFVDHIAEAFLDYRQVNLSNAMRRTASKLKIRPTLDGFYRYLKEDGPAS